MTERSTNQIRPVEVTCWGCRGSCPAPYGDRIAFGGNTSCYFVETKEAILILDGGTGLAGLGEALAARDDVKTVCIFISHLHLDHISGIPFFKPLRDPKMRIIFCGGEEQPGQMRAGLEAMMAPPYWPVALKDCPAKVEYRMLREGRRFQLPGGLSLEIMRSNHPGETFICSIMAENRKIVYGLDCEMDGPMMERLSSFARGADLVICDAQYSPADYEAHRGWGHSTWREGAQLARLCRAKRICFSHFAWEYGDLLLMEMEKDMKKVCAGGFFAREQMKILI